MDLTSIPLDNFTGEGAFILRSYSDNSTVQNDTLAVLDEFGWSRCNIAYKRSYRLPLPCIISFSALIDQYMFVLTLLFNTVCHQLQIIIGRIIDSSHLSLCLRRRSLPTQLTTATKVMRWPTTDLNTIIGS